MKKTFKKYLSEQEDFLTTRQEIEEWLDEQKIRNYSINRDLTVHVSIGVNLEFHDFEYLPVKFDMVEGDFKLSNNGLKSLKGAPRKVIDSFVCVNNPHLLSFEYLPEIVGGDVILGRNQAKSFEGINFENCEWRGDLRFDFHTVQSHLLGLIYVKGLKRIKDSGADFSFRTAQTKGAVKIIEKYLGHPEKIFDCQAELIEHGFDEYAKL